MVPSQFYLSNRKQYISINGISSEPLEINCGVPQGSVLGPLLFLLYINDLPNISNVLDFYLFADDTNIYYESVSLQDLENTINKELNQLYFTFIERFCNISLFPDMVTYG